MAPRYPPEWLERVPAEVFACLVPGEIRILIAPGLGHANGGAPHDVPLSIVPPELRMPNTPLWVELSNEMAVLRVWRRERSEPQSAEE